MSTYPTLKEWSRERADLAGSAAAKAVAVTAGKRVLSGIHWRRDLVVTSAEAIGGSERAGVRFAEVDLDSEVVATDLGTDIAILRIPRETPAPASSETSTAERRVAAAAAQNAASQAEPPAAPSGQRAAVLRLGESVVLVGRTLRGPAAIWGSVQLTGPAWNSRRGGKIGQRLELDVSFSPDFEGAAVLDMDGNIAAMAVPGPRHRVLGIPAETIEGVVSKVETTGRLPKPYIGIRLQSLWLDDDTRARLGRTSRGIAAVGGVDAGSPAADAHIALGDLLLSLDGEPAESVAGLAQKIASVTPGQTVALEVLRGGKPLVIQVRVGERPSH